ncbi:oligopeptide transporter 4-like [Gossypium australe]|uniref:Oligopeptide transporter 4-like n=1 Tax=Gossypium australe TaxID=47621 RepID=A0A5B6V8A1_9ROSI|nr:oligopeptide transporter 4-like [Gossypium australe]
MDQRTLHEYTLPTLDVVRGSIEGPMIDANNFEIKTATIQMIQNTLQFKGNMIIPCVFGHFRSPYETMQLIELGSITTWNDLAKKIIYKTFLNRQTIQLRREITNFKQFEGESFYEACERFKIMLRKCPYHGHIKSSLGGASNEYLMFHT